jgi:hypothetical protein
VVVAAANAVSGSNGPEPSPPPALGPFSVGGIDVGLGSAHHPALAVLLCQRNEAVVAHLFKLIFLAHRQYGASHLMAPYAGEFLLATSFEARPLPQPPQTPPLPPPRLSAKLLTPLPHLTPPSPQGRAGHGRARRTEASKPSRASCTMPTTSGTSDTAAA